MRVRYPRPRHIRGFQKYAPIRPSQHTRTVGAVDGQLWRGGCREDIHRSRWRGGVTITVADNAIKIIRTRIGCIKIEGCVGRIGNVGQSAAVSTAVGLPLIIHRWCNTAYRYSESRSRCRKGKESIRGGNKNPRRIHRRWWRTGPILSCRYLIQSKNIGVKVKTSQFTRKTASTTNPTSVTRPIFDFFRGVNVCLFLIWLQGFIPNRV